MFFYTRYTSCLMHIVIDGAYNNMVGHRANIHCMGGSQR